MSTVHPYISLSNNNIFELTLNIDCASQKADIFMIAQ